MIQAAPWRRAPSGANLPYIVGAWKPRTSPKALDSPTAKDARGFSAHRDYYALKQ
jgi:hypothetical protein